MSWNSTPIKPTDMEHVMEAIGAAQVQAGTNPATIEHEAQLAAAKQAALLLIASGALGDGADGRMFLVDLHGHANNGHQPTPGWANDAVSIQLRSEPADSDAVRYAREAFERWEAQKVKA